MALREEQIEAVRMTIKGMNSREIGDVLGYERTTVWRWTQTDEWREMLKSMQHEIKTQGENRIMGQVNTYISELERLALTSDSEKIRYDSLTYMIDRIMGKATSRIADVTEAKQTKIDKVDLQEEINSFKLIEIDCKDNKIDNKKAE